MRTLGATRTFTRIAAAAVIIVGLTSAAEAANTTASLAVSSTVSNNCTISTTPLGFGSYDPVGNNASTGTDATGSGAVVIACTKGASANIELGNGGGSDANSRRLVSGANLLPYQLYRADASTVWGSGVGTGAVSYTSLTKAQQSLTVQGKIPKGADVPAGTYEDTIVATINF